ncbi:MAG: hypothetical protein J6W16_07485 [Methanobrevibacter sp.]|nr:hypothetical protein [Methanobrevibacter sp.]
MAEYNTVERIIQNIGTQSPYAADLAQDIYEDLLKKDEDYIKKLWENNEMTFFLVRMVKNNINSVTSPFYRKYEMFRKKSDELKNEKEED